MVMGFDIPASTRSRNPAPIACSSASDGETIAASRAATATEQRDELGTDRKRSGVSKDRMREGIRCAPMAAWWRGAGPRRH